MDVLIDGCGEEKKQTHVYEGIGDFCRECVIDALIDKYGGRVGSPTMKRRVLKIESGED